MQTRRTNSTRKTNRSGLWLCAALLAGTLLSFPTEARADVYAARLQMTNPDGKPFDGKVGDGTGVLLSFILNDNADKVVVRVKDAASGATVYTKDLGALARGKHSHEWNGAGAVSGKSYKLEVFAEQKERSSTEWTVSWDSGDIDLFSRGVDIIRDQNSPRFGMFYAPNSGGPLKKGIRVYEPDGSFGTPELLHADAASGGTADWGSSSDHIFSGMFDDQGRFYLSQVQAGEIRRINADQSMTTVVQGLNNPKGLWVRGTGAQRTLFVAADKEVLRIPIGTADTFTGTPEVVGRFEKGFPRNVAVDDAGALYVSFRSSNSLSSDPKGLDKYDLSGTLPVGDNNSVWSISETQTFRVSSMTFDHGKDRTKASDDVLYFAARAGTGNPGDGVYRIDDIAAFAPQPQQLVSETALYNGDSNINDRAAITLDAAGNIILMENSNEHIFFLDPPRSTANNSFTTTSATAVTVTVSTSVEAEDLPTSYRLDQNFPNPFNPTTTISYRLGQDGHTTVQVYSTLGQLVRTLVDRHQAAGTYEVTWDGRDEAHAALGSGVYLLRVSSGAFNQTIRMTLLK